MQPILEWLASNHELAALVVSLCTLLVWVTYLQVFLAGYRRQRRGAILITVGQGHGLEGRCLVTNMGAEPVYILALLAQVESRDGVCIRAITELEGEQWSEPSDLRLWTRQGPLDSSELRDMGTLQSMVNHVLDAGAGAHAGNEGPEQRAAGLRSVLIRVIALHGSEELPIGAERAFDVVGDGATLHPRTYGTRQIRSRRGRRQLTRLLDEHSG
jgi:hypothetical protein